MDNSDDDISDIQSSGDDIDILIPAALLLTTMQSQQRSRMPSNRLYTGQDYVNNLLTCNNDIRIHSQLRMKLETFNTLRDWLLENTELRSSRYISIEEKLLIFIFTSSSDMSSRAAREQFNRGANTISL